MRDIVIFLLGLGLCGVGFDLFAAKGDFPSFQKSIRSRVCRKRLGTLKEFRQLFAIKEFRTLISKQSSPKLVARLGTVSSDLLVEVVLQLEQDYQVLCPEHKGLERMLDQLKRGYLSHLELPTNHFSAKEVNLLFRGLLVMKDEIPALREQLVPFRKLKFASQILPMVFGAASELRNVALLGASDRRTQVLTEIIQELCEGFKLCPFWDSRLIYKTMLTARPGVAVYLPELAVLILSAEILDKPHRLHRLVLLHELAHVAERGAWVYQRRRWRDDFVKFSGWQKNKKGNWAVRTRQPAGKREDELSELSEKSAFSILPDPVYLGFSTLGKPADGFVFGKSYEESLRQNDPSEDLADHVAAFFYLPERFCFEGVNIAPKKYGWIAKNVFGKKKELNCSPKPTKGSSD